jgi:hypothetical protein
MRRLALIGLVAALALAVTAGASGVTLKMNWVERTTLSTGGTYTMYVRKIEITKTTWRAWVGLANRTGRPMQIQYGLVHQGPRTVLVHGPGIWFQGPIAPGATISAPRHIDATTVRPPLPHTLAAGRSWFATISGPTAKLPRDRLLRIGFGFLVKPDSQYNTELSTTHQFKLPRRL